MSSERDDIRPRRRRWSAVVLGLLALAIAAIAGRGYAEEAWLRARGAASGAPEAALTDLRRPDRLVGAFNRARGQPRLVLFLSPT